MDGCGFCEYGVATLSPSPYGSNSRWHVSLIEAQSRVLSLEGEVSHLKHQLSAEKLKRGTATLTTSTLGPAGEDDQVKKRCLELEQESCCLTQELENAKLKLEEAAVVKENADGKYKHLQSKFAGETRTLQDQLEDLSKQNCSLDIAYGGLQMELRAEQLLQPSHQLKQMEQLKESYSKSVKGLKTRLSELEQVERELLCSQVEVKQLQAQLRTYRHETQFVGHMRGKLEQLESLGRQVSLQKEEIAGLQQCRANTHLLRYQVQGLDRKCEELQVLKEQVVYLGLENSKMLAAQGDASKSMNVCEDVLLQLAELQQREAVSVSKCGSLHTQLEVNQQALAQCQAHLQQVQASLLEEKARAVTMEDRVQKLERRLIFVTKERDGCVNVLNSYKLDTGVDSLTKKWLTELRQQLEEKTKRIEDLEAELEDKKRLARNTPTSCGTL